jgi:hypothetical protein
MRRRRATELGFAWDRVVLLSLAPPGTALCFWAWLHRKWSRAIEFGSTWDGAVFISLAPPKTELWHWVWLHLMRSQAKGYFVKSFQNQVILWDISRFRLILSKSTSTSALKAIPGHDVVGRRFSHTTPPPPSRRHTMPPPPYWLTDRCFITFTSL